MKTSVSLIFVLIFNIASYDLIRGQAGSQQHPDDVVRVRTNEVKLDVVVKDKKGRPVKDLTAGDFEIEEDGVRQQIDTFRFVTRETAVVETASQPTEKSGSMRTETAPTNLANPGIVALVFDRLSPEARALARKAGLAYAKEDIARGDFTGVFGIDQSLHTYQSFTENAETVRVAIERA